MARAREAYLNAHEQDGEAEQHVVLAEKKELGKPHISKKMRALLKQSGKPVCVKDLVQNVAAPAEEVRLW